jgi:hypothetical protein
MACNLLAQEVDKACPEDLEFNCIRQSIARKTAGLFEQLRGNLDTAIILVFSISMLKNSD